MLAAAIPWLWFLVAAIAAVRSRRGGPAWWLAVGGALVLASLHLWGWNKPIYLWGKNTLIELGVYERRIAVKFAIGLVFFPLALWLGVRAWRRSRRLWPLLRAALGLMALDALYVTVRSLSVDGWMPLWIGAEPGKSLLGAALAGLALAAVVFARPGAPAAEEEEEGERFVVR